MEILCLGGMPTPQQWEHYDSWWISTRAQESVENDPNSPTWAILIMWKAKLFMNEYWNLTAKLMVNPFVLSLEEIIWSLHLLSQVEFFGVFSKKFLWSDRTKNCN